VTYEFRNNSDFTYGTLNTAAAISDTSISSADFATLSSGYSAGNYLPIILLNAAAKTHEKVWITGHTAASTAVTVVRARESTAAQAWPSGTQWIVAPTIRDALPSGNAASPPTDPHVGLRLGCQDKAGEVRQWTRFAGYQADVGVAIPADIGKTRAAAAVANGHAMIVRAGYGSGVTDASGLFTVTYNVPFPNATLVVIPQVSSTYVNPVTCQSETATGFTCKAWRYTALNVATNENAGSNVPIVYIAIGW
jgi:hypothetical protein